MENLKHIVYITFILILISCDDNAVNPEPVDLNDVEEIELGVNHNNILGVWELVYESRSRKNYKEGEREIFDLKSDSSVVWSGRYMWSSDFIVDIVDSRGEFLLLPNNKFINIRTEDYVSNINDDLIERSRFFGFKVLRLTNKRLWIIENGAVIYNCRRTEYSDTCFLHRPNLDIDLRE